MSGRLKGAVRTEIVIERAGRDIAKFFANLGNRARGVRHEMLRIAQLLRGHDAGTPTIPAARPGCAYPFTNTLIDDVAFHFGKGGLDLHEGTACRCCCVHWRIQRPESDPLFFKPVDQRDQLRGLPAQAIKIQHNENISPAQVIEAGGKLCATSTGSRCAILEYPLAPGFLQCVKLPVEHLPALERGDAGISYLAHGNHNAEKPLVDVDNCNMFSMGFS